MWSLLCSKTSTGFSFPSVQKPKSLHFLLKDSLDGPKHPFFNPGIQGGLAAQTKDASLYPTHGAWACLGAGRGTTIYGKGEADFGVRPGSRLTLPLALGILTSLSLHFLTINGAGHSAYSLGWMRKPTQSARPRICHLIPAVHWPHVSILPTQRLGDPQGRNLVTFFCDSIHAHCAWHRASPSAKSFWTAWSWKIPGLTFGTTHRNDHPGNVRAEIKCHWPPLQVGIWLLKVTGSVQQREGGWIFFFSLQNSSQTLSLIHKGKQSCVLTSNLSS